VEAGATDASAARSAHETESPILSLIVRERTDRSWAGNAEIRPTGRQARARQKCEKIKSLRRFRTIKHAGTTRRRRACAIVCS